MFFKILIKCFTNMAYISKGKLISILDFHINMIFNSKKRRAHLGNKFDKTRQI